MRFKEYLIKNHTKKSLQEELITGGILKMIKRLEYWFDFSEKTTDERIHHLEQELINNGGPQKFAMIVRRIPSVQHFLIKHIDELTGDLLHTAKLLH